MWNRVNCGYDEYILMPNISEAIRWNLIEHFIVAQPSWGSGGAASPHVGPGQHPVGVQGAKPSETLEIWHFPGTKQRPKTALIERILTSCLYFSLQQMTIFIGINGDNPIWLMRTEKD